MKSLKSFAIFVNGFVNTIVLLKQKPLKESKTEKMR